MSIDMIRSIMMHQVLEWKDEEKKTRNVLTVHQFRLIISLSENNSYQYIDINSYKNPENILLIL